MRNSPASSWNDLVAIGEIARSQGRLGEVVINPLSDFPDRFHGLRHVFVEGEDGTPAELEVEWVREQNGRPVLKFRGVSGIGEAQSLAGSEMRLPETELVALPEDTYFHFRLRGCDVWDVRTGYLGVVADVHPTGGTDLLVVRAPDGGERLIPFCKDICRRIDIGEGRIDVDAPEGLITLNADRHRHHLPRLVR